MAAASVDDNDLSPLSGIPGVSGDSSHIGARLFGVAGQLTDVANAVTPVHRTDACHDTLAGDDSLDRSIY